MEYFLARGRTSNRAGALEDGSGGEVGSCKLAAETVFARFFTCAEISACSVVVESRDCERNPGGSGIVKGFDVGDCKELASQILSDSC
jgi:hypothetical protein